jgi:acyl-CoA thioesterase FadM
MGHVDNAVHNTCLVVDSRGVTVMYDYARHASIAVPDDVRQRIEAHAGREFPRPA